MCRTSSSFGLCQIVKPASVAANTSVPAANAAVTIDLNNPVPFNSSADDTNVTVPVVSSPDSAVKVKVNDNSNPSMSNNSVASVANDNAAAAPPALANPFTSANDANIPPAGVTPHTKSPAVALASTVTRKPLNSDKSSLTSNNNGVNSTVNARRAVTSPSDNASVNS